MVVVNDDEETDFEFHVYYAFYFISLYIFSRHWSQFLSDRLLQDAKRGTELDYIVARKNPLQSKSVYLELWVRVQEKKPWLFHNDLIEEFLFDNICVFHILFKSDMERFYFPCRGHRSLPFVRRSYRQITPKGPYS